VLISLGSDAADLVKIVHSLVYKSLNAQTAAMSFGMETPLHALPMLTETVTPAW